MSSILTNNSAMVALQTLKSINSNLAKTQDQIATGKDIVGAKDNSAIWAISKVMESDVSGFNAVSDSLAIGESTVAVASAGAEEIVNVLKEMKELAISGASETADFAKIEADMAEKEAQITAIIGASQFNGVNLLKTDADGNGGTQLTVISSLDRAGANTSANGNAPTISTIDVATADFEAGLAVAGRTAVADAADAQTALTEIEGFLQVAIEGAAALGASGKRISDQNSFVGKLTDAMKAGIGSLVDADMEEASARLQALQTQQQLGVQALSIANQAPQTILSLFR
ncbi:flagellin N-terminal helical domain-containing protein [Sedimentitalea nanhaiensis]|uniref:Flagellin n=1 Tax=Sedimentitalea nanhaiensis TaxID=999627 RepID=A0A1I7CA27_9RHOB|nr:flagellin [Sedimentitalea nanhaiensis]SFT96291.1 flagellin [Sedimentitalea nanhaiensis]